MEGKAFFQSYDLAPRPPPSPPPVSSTGNTQEDWERETSYWRESGKGVGEEPNYTTKRKPGSL